MPSTQIPDAAIVEAKIAEILEKNVGVDRAAALAGVPFVELSAEFDSLALLEMQLLLEDEYGIDFERAAALRDRKLPANVHELAKLVLACHSAATPGAATLDRSGPLDTASSKTLG